MANQYRVNPVELVRTDPRLVLLVFSMATWPEALLAAGAAELAAGAADVLAELAAPPELPPQAASRAAIATAKTANAAGSHLW
jgi:hypothetical protein